MTKKITVKMMLDSEKRRRNAMKLAVKVPGITKVDVDKDKGQITITGADVDPIAVVKALKGESKLRKLLCGMFPKHGVGSIDLATVEEVKEEKKAEEKKSEEKKAEAGYPYWYPPLVFQLVEGPHWWW